MKRGGGGKTRLKNPDAKLVEAFVQAVLRAVDKIAIDPTDRPAALALVTTMIEVINDQKFRGAWVDPEFQSACYRAIEAHIKRI
jgi:hypothetical protein